jgi:flagellar basal-body rod protein FlgB
MKIFNDVGFRSLSGALDGLMARQRVTTNNIANVDTPGFKAQFVKFEDQLQLALKTGDDAAGLPLTTTQAGHMPFSLNPGSPLIQVSHNQNDLRNDTNNVDIDLEMTSLAETNLRYQALTQLTANKLGLLKRIVRGGK